MSIIKINDVLFVRNKPRILFLSADRKVMIYMTDKELFNELSYKRKNVYENLSEQEYKEMFELCDEYREFLDEGKTERECVEKSIKMA